MKQELSLSLKPNHEPQNEPLGAQGGIPETPLHLKHKPKKILEQEKAYLETTFQNLDDDFGSEEKIIASTSNDYKTKYLQYAVYEILSQNILYLKGSVNS